MDWYYIIAIILGPLFVLMFVGLPVAFSFLAVNIVGSFVLMGGLPGIKQLVLNTVDSVSSFVLIPIALFMIMGEAMFRSGIAVDLMDTLDKWFGRLRGRLALMAVGGGVLFSTLTGNSMGSIALLGSSLTPEMEKRGYKKPMSLGPILGSSGLAIMIPPSALAVVLGVIAELSIRRILIGIIIPGLLMALLYIIYIIGRCRLQPELAPSFDIPKVPLSEKLSASDLVELLNDYLTEMTDILLDNKGTLDKYIGDAIVAFYGAPAPVDDHEYWACLTAVKMQDRLAELREKWQSEGDRWPEIVHNMQNRIGINTGQMVTGNMGSTMRMNYTMMGDTVNLAARLEASAKQYGVYIQVAEESYEACKDKFIWRDLDFVIVMGKTEPAQVFELIAEKDNMPKGYDKLLPAYHEAVKLYRSQEWQKAIEAFKASDELEDMFPGRKTNPSRIYIPRCEHYLENPPGDDWDGSWALTKK